MSLFGFILFTLLFEPSLIALLVAFAIFFTTTGTAPVLMTLFFLAVRITATAILARERCRNTARQAQ
jgi:hypothetical protein